ncbi:MAG: cation transporter [Deltaproteobacteria bacterium]|nr:cation transporter [Deltaproteobacteria bacterium]
MDQRQTRNITLTVEGMHCEGCAEKLTARLRKLAGVAEATVSFAERRARIAYDPGAADQARITAEIEKSGFSAAEEKADPSQQGNGSGQALAAARSAVSQRGLSSTLLSVPAVLASLIPSATCPLCLAGYTALLATLGLGFLTSPAYLMALTAALLAIALAALGFEAVRRGNWGPFMLCLCGSVVVVVGKFLFASEAATYAGVTFLLAASLWNLAPRLLGLRSAGAKPAVGGAGDCG